MATKRATGGTKIELGQFYTAANPFGHPRVRRWLDELGSGGKWLEPFAGANHIVAMITATAGARNWQSFDIEPGAEGVETRDVLAHFPRGFDVVATNPPYLARNSARRRGYAKALEAMKGWEDLYLRCIEECLTHVGHVAAIIPESFIGSGHFRDRLRFVISLTQAMFTDTEHPVCLAVFGPETGNDFEVWSGEQLVGTWSTISAHELAVMDDAIPLLPGWAAASTPTSTKPACVTDEKASIRFTRRGEVAAGEIKHSSRHKTRIHVPSLRDADEAMLEAVIAESNRILARWRKNTGDVLMSPFMGLRGDGMYRRRLDYANAAAILAAAVERCERRGKQTNGARGEKPRNRHNLRRAGRRS